MTPSPLLLIHLPHLIHNPLSCPVNYSYTGTKGPSVHTDSQWSGRGAGAVRDSNPKSNLTTYPFDDIRGPHFSGFRNRDSSRLDCSVSVGPLVSRSPLNLVDGREGRRLSEGRGETRSQRGEPLHVYTRRLNTFVRQCVQTSRDRGDPSLPWTHLSRRSVLHGPLM